MLQFDDRTWRAPSRHAVLVAGAFAFSAALAVPGLTLAQDGPSYRSPPVESAPRAAPAVPGDKAKPGGGQGEAPGAADRDGTRQDDFTPGCPYRERPLNLLV